MLKRVVLSLSATAIVAVILMGAAATPKKADPKLVARGKYLVDATGCDDCHTPKNFGPQGPMPDMSRRLSGSPSSNKVPAVPANVLGPDKWGALALPDLTGWCGPWGISFARNLTPDKQTGLGSWTEAMFIKAIRTGKDMGSGRDILPPMPWQQIRNYNDGDLQAIFAYLQSLPPISNAVHDPIPPAGH
jgi:hypothetical protein